MSISRIYQKMPKINYPLCIIGSQFVSGLIAFPFFYHHYILNHVTINNNIAIHMVEDPLLHPKAILSSFYYSSLLGLLSPIITIPFIGLSPIWVPSYMIYSYISSESVKKVKELEKKVKKLENISSN